MPRQRAPVTYLLGPILVRARARGVPWKVLEGRYGYCRKRLWELWNAQRKREADQELAPQKRL